MKRRDERTVRGGGVAVLIPETQEDLEEIERMAIRGEVDTYASFGDRRAEVAAAEAEVEPDEEDTDVERAG